MSSFLVCRVCLEINSPEACKNVQQIQTETDVLEMLSYSIPEMVFTKLNWKKNY